MTTTTMMLNMSLGTRQRNVGTIWYGMFCKAEEFESEEEALGPGSSDPMLGCKNRLHGHKEQQQPWPSA